ncbi:MerC domain-containing protein [uncultured Maribacter sp.]|uniref:MerC domain-containing protein n=1 Tax=uncultured Maribacter sp. TaxID=431308 RepID=UPI0026055476|nr:MerC domain-containing protein [uncultured Maribacter sp.]
MILVKQKSDILGTLASTLCLVHCMATPFIFIAQAGSAICCHTPPTWWKFMDYFFLILSFFAIYWSTKTTSIKWIKPMLWISWFTLLFVLLNEKMGVFPLAEAVIYVPALALIFLHLYNKKYCNCNTDKCCVDKR